MSKEIASTIANQIKCLDRMAMMAWGTKKLFILPESETSLGGLRIVVSNNPKIKSECFVDITLNGKDLYDIKVWKQRYKTVNFVRNYFEDVYATKEDIYFNDLVSVIDNILG